MLTKCLPVKLLFLLLLFIPTAVHAQLNGNVASCVGDLVIYNCTVQSHSHIWEADAFQIDPGRPITPPQRTNHITGPPEYWIELTTIGSSSINSSLSVVTFADLNGTNITCHDGIILSGERQRTTAVVYGKSHIK